MMLQTRIGTTICGGCLREQGGVENPTDEELRRFDRQRKDKRVSNEEWMSPTDQDSRIGKMKDGRTHLLYKAEHVVDLEPKSCWRPRSIMAMRATRTRWSIALMDAQTNLSEAGTDVEIEEAAADKGYHATDTMELADWLNIRTYIPEPKRKGKRKWQGVPEEKRRAVINNRRRTRGARVSGSTAAKRTGGKKLRPRVRHRGCPAELVAWDREVRKALPDCDGGPQPGL